MRNREMPVLVRSVINQYDGAKIRGRVDSELSWEIDVKVVMHQGSVLSHFFLEDAVDVVIGMAKEGVLSELLYADDLMLMSETIDGHTISS